MPSKTRTPDAPAPHWAERYTLRGLETLSGLAAFEGLALMVLAGVLTLSASGGADAGALTLAALVLGVSGWLIFQGARLVRIHHLQTAASTPKATPEKRRLLLNEMFVWLFLSLAALTGAVLAKPEIAGTRLLELDTPAGLIAFMGLLGAAFIPAIAGIIRTERQLATTRPDRKILREDAISPGSLYVGLIVMALIVLLAWAAARDTFASLGENMGVIVTLFVMFAFLFFIVLSSVTRGLNLFQERDRKPATANGPTASLATVASWIDSILVRIVAPLTGAVQAPDGRHGLGWHHAMIIMILAPLTLLGYALPQPWGLIPIALAFLFALAIGRRWAWVEGDRETASRLRTTKGKDIHVGFSNDLRDEALLGYSFLFVLVPLTLFQLNEMTGAFCLRSTGTNGELACATGDGQGAFRDWIGFFGLELLKAVPLVDWVEIYGLNAQPSLMPSPGLDVSKHLMFGSRVLVDFVVMAALFQAISIFQRNHTQRTLYDSGQLDVLDPISEEDFFETGMIRVSKTAYEAWQKLPIEQQDINPVVQLENGSFFTAKSGFMMRIQQHVGQQRDNGVPRPYASERLDQLVDDDRLDLQAGALWMVAKYKLLAGSPRHRLGQIDFRNSVAKGESAEDNETPSEITQRVTATNRVLADASQESSDIGDQDLGSFLRLAASVADIPVSQIALTSVLERLHSANALLVLKLMTQSSPAAHPELESILGKGCGSLKLGATLAGIRATMFNSIGIVGERAAQDGTPESIVVAEDALAFCVSKSKLFISGGDRAAMGQKAAKAAADKIRAALKIPA